MRNRLLLLMVAIVAVVTMAFKSAHTSNTLTFAVNESEMMTFANDTTDTEVYDEEEVEESEEVEEEEEDSAE